MLSIGNRGADSVVGFLVRDLRDEMGLGLEILSHGGLVLLTESLLLGVALAVPRLIGMNR